MPRIVLNIQSISDVITNSSSELFCTIICNNNSEAISDLLSRIFKGDDAEFEPTLFTYDDDTIEVWLPYDYFGLTEFFREGLIAILDKYFKDCYTINWDD